MKATPVIARAFGFVSVIVNWVVLPTVTEAGWNCLLTSGASSTTIGTAADISEVLFAASIAVAVIVQPLAGGTNAMVEVKVALHWASVVTLAEPMYWYP